MSNLRRRFDIFPAKHRTRPVLIGFIMIAVIAVALVSAAVRHVPLTPKGGHLVSAEFAAADQVSSRTVVRVNGIDVGRVDRVEAGSDPYRSSRVVMRITDGGVRLRADASAQIRWRTLLGGLMYIDLHPGSAAASLNGPIPVSRTSNQVELDQVLETYSGATAERQRSLFRGLSDTLADPPGVRQTLHTLSPAMRTIAAGLQPVLGQQQGDLRGLIAATGNTVKGLDNSAGLQSLVTGAEETFAVTDAQRTQLGQTLELSPPSLQSTFTTMGRLRTTLGHLDPLVTALRPGARALAPAAQAATPALAETQTILNQLQPLLRAAGPTFDSLRAASPPAVSFMNGLQPTLSRARSNILPWLRVPDSGTKLPTYEMIGPFWSDLAEAAGEYDSVGYRIRFTVPFGSNSFISSAVQSQMGSACARSSLAHRARDCAKATSLLMRGWFGSFTGGGKR